MATNNQAMIKKLQNAINQKFDQRLLINQTQWYSDDRDSPVTVYTIKQSIYDDDRERNINIEVFSAYSPIQIVLWLRDYWYELNGWEVPKDNERWLQIKEEYYKKAMED